MNLKWTDPTEPKNGVSHYDHCICETPLGNFIIEWKSWKEAPSYDVTIDGGWVACAYSLEEAKKATHDYIVELYNELTDFINH